MNNDSLHDNRLRKKRVRRKPSGPRTGDRDRSTLVFWNARGIRNKEEVFKAFLKQQGALYGGVSESHTYKNNELTDAEWQWEAGKEVRPAAGASGPPKGSMGLGAFSARRKSNSSVVYTGKYSMWHRIEMGKGSLPLFVGVCYFPQASNLAGHRRANEELQARIREYKAIGHVLFGGDMNCHTQSNGDTHPHDLAGGLFLSMVDDMDMHLVNSIEDICVGQHSRVEVRIRKDGIQRTTVDYVVCSPSLLRINSLPPLAYPPRRPNGVRSQTPRHHSHRHHGHPPQARAAARGVESRRHPIAT